MAGQEKLKGAAREIYDQLLARFGPNPSDVRALVAAAAKSFASKLGVSTMDAQIIAELVIRTAEWESGLRQIPSGDVYEQSYGLFQLNLRGKGTGFTAEELLGDAILNAVVGADYLVKLAKAGLAAGGPEEAARRMVLGGQTDAGFLGGQAPLGSGIVSGSPGAGETDSDAQRVRAMIAHIADVGGSYIGFGTPTGADPSIGSPQSVSSYPKLDDYRTPDAYGKLTGPPDWASYMQAVALWVEPYVYAGQPLPPGAPTEAHMVYDMVGETRGLEKQVNQRENLATYIDSLVKSIGADVESKSLSMNQAVLEFDRQMKAMEQATTSWENAMQWSIPPGAEYVPGYEPGGIATQLGMEPWKASPVGYNPFEMAQQVLASTPAITSIGAPDMGNLFAQALALVQSGAVAPGGGAASVGSVPSGVPAASSPTVVPGAAMGTAPVTPDMATRNTVPINPQWSLGYRSGAA